jgi:hypothetical protein
LHVKVNKILQGFSRFTLFLACAIQYRINIKKNSNFFGQQTADILINMTKVMLYTQKYYYLRLTLNEILDYKVTAKFVSQAAGRALGLLIAKFKAIGGMPFHVYTRLFDNLVWPAIA